MKSLKTCCLTLLLICIGTFGRLYAQIGSMFTVGAHIGLAAGGSRESKQERLVEQSSKQEKIAGVNTTMLRVKESSIKSKAKKNIVAQLSQ